MLTCQQGGLSEALPEDMKDGCQTFLPVGKHKIETDGIPSVVLTSLQEGLLERQTEVKKDGFQTVFPPIRREGNIERSIARRNQRARAPST